MKQEAPVSISSRPLLELRSHPLMHYRGTPSWPPTWTQSAPGGENRTMRGEIGVLKEVNGEDESANKFYLVIEHEGERYVGTMLLDDLVFGWFIAKVFRSHIGWRIEEIGSLDLSFSL